MFTSVDLLLKVLDKATQLLSLRVDNKRRMFKEVIEPLFQELEPVVEGYFSFFNGAIEEIKASKIDGLQEVIEKLRILREQMLVARMKVQQFAEAIEISSKDKQINELAKRVLLIFYCTRHLDNRKMSRSAQYVEFLDNLPTDVNRSSKVYLVEATRRTKDEIAQAWLRASQSYAALRLDSVC